MSKLFFCLAVSSFAIFTVFTALSGADLFRYLRCGMVARAEVYSWSVVESRLRFSLVASYRYRVLGEEFHGETIFLKAPFPSERAAKAALGQLSLTPWKVWYCRQKPQESTLQRLFPFKMCIYAVLFFALSIYFYVMRCFFAKRRSSVA